jgi:hypothetical protein
MIRRWSKSIGAGRYALALIFVAGISVLPVAAADDGAGAPTGEPNLQQRVGAVFYRSMAHWRYDYSKIPSGKAGVACIPWARLDDAFLDNGIFEALGFSYSMASDESAIQVATQGCDQMKAHYRLSDCDCELVLVGDTVVVEVPK